MKGIHIPTYVVAHLGSSDHVLVDVEAWQVAISIEERSNQQIGEETVGDGEVILIRCLSGLPFRSYKVGGP